jgi:hypothetical protein
MSGEDLEKYSQENGAEGYLKEVFNVDNLESIDPTILENFGFNSAQHMIDSV